MPTCDLDRICAIAARLNEDAELLRSLGLDEAADLLVAAQARLDKRVYADANDPNGEAEALCAPIVYHRPRRGRRVKGRDVRTH